MADLGEGPGGMRLGAGAQGLAPPPPLTLGKKEEIAEGRKAGRASKTKQNYSTSPPPPPLSSRAGSVSDLCSKTEFVGLANNKVSELIQFLNIEVVTLDS